MYKGQAMDVPYLPERKPTQPMLVSIFMIIATELRVIQRLLEPYSLHLLQTLKTIISVSKFDLQGCTGESWTLPWQWHLVVVGTLCFAHMIKLLDSLETVVQPSTFREVQAVRLIVIDWSLFEWATTWLFDMDIHKTSSSSSRVSKWPGQRKSSADSWAWNGFTPKTWDTWGHWCALKVVHRINIIYFVFVKRRPCC